MNWPLVIALILSPFSYPLCSHLRRTPFILYHTTIPDKPLFDLNANLSVCTTELSSSNGSCCTKELETLFLNTMRQELVTVYHDRIIALKQSLTYHYQLFDKQYKETINISSRQLHAMFTRTYGALYQSHTQIFVKLFDELQEFYSESKYTPLKPILDRFFFDLFRTLLHILNPTDEIREDKSDCLKNSLALEAFGDIPLKMARQVERSLGAAKCLVHALKSSSDILQDVLQKELPTNCHVTATKMKYCAQCLPNPGSSTIGKTLKPCQMYCFNTINECFADYIVIENTWQQFIEALTKLAARLRGPYNVMAVLIPLAVQISESIMVFQEKAPAISARIARKCLRKDNGQSLKRETIPFKTSSESLPDFSSALSDAQSELLSSFVEKVRGTSGFWKVGPRLACINLTWIATTSDDLCWDGTKIVDNLKVTDEVSDNGIGSNFTTSVFLMERLKLLMLSNQLLESYEGRAYNDSIDVDVESSGNGDSYASVDDEDGDEFRDEGSGFDENQGAIVVDVAGSHRDITELATEESDIRNRSTIAPEPSVTLPMPHLEIAKISAAQKSFYYTLFLMTIFYIL